MTRSRVVSAVSAVAVAVVLVVGFFVLRPGSSPAASTTSASTSSASAARATAASSASAGCSVKARTVPGAAESKLAVKPLCALPPEAVKVAGLIQKGGPFPYSRDGIVFGNRERILPQEKNGFYHEYTVTTPGESDRGARRIVAGGPTGPQQWFFYSDDHYSSFSVVDVTAAP